MADVVRAAPRQRSADSKDPPESEIPIAPAQTHRGSYTSGFSTPLGARNPSTFRNDGFGSAKDDKLPFQRVDACVSYAPLLSPFKHLIVDPERWCIAAAAFRRSAFMYDAWIEVEPDLGDRGKE